MVSTITNPFGRCTTFSPLMSSLDMANYQLYIIEGTIITVFNLALGMIIVLNKTIRQQKEYLIYAGCMFFDVIFGMAYLTSGAYRLQIANTYPEFPMTTRFGCLMSAHNFLFVYVTPTAGILVFFTSIDRFIGVFFPTKYIRLRTNYVYGLLGMAFSIPLIALPVAIFTSYPYQTDCDQSSVCILNQAVTSEVFLSLRLVRIFGSLACVFFYIPISVRIFQNVKRASAHAYMASSQGRRLMRTTVTVLLVTLNTIILYVVPDLILLIDPTTSSFIFYLMNLNKGLVNIFIFLITQKTLRKAILNSLRFGDRRSNLLSTTPVNHQTQANTTRTVTATRKPGVR